MLRDDTRPFAVAFDAGFEDDARRVLDAGFALAGSSSSWTTWVRFRLAGALSGAGVALRAREERRGGMLRECDRLGGQRAAIL